MNELTPGPWTWDYSNDVGPDDDYFIEFFEIRNDKHELVGRADREADARLIAAAPDLLEALQRLLVSVESHEDAKTLGELGSIGQAYAAIAKATGETK